LIDKWIATTHSLQAKTASRPASTLTAWRKRSLLYEGAELVGTSSPGGRRTFLTNLANKGTAIHILKTLAGHRSISTTATYLYSSASQLKAAVELV